MATVFLAEDVYLHRQVAIKVFDAHSSEIKNFQRLFVREGRVLARLDHPNILPIYEYGEHSQLLHERFFRNLHIPHLQLDELRTRLRKATQILWLWLAIDPLTKMIPVLELGPRTQKTAHVLIHSLRQSLASGCLPLFTSDVLNLYFYALTAHFDTGYRRIAQGAKSSDGRWRWA